MSTNAKKIAIKTTTTNTTSVICTVSFRVGHTTFFASKTTLFKKVNNSLPLADCLKIKSDKPYPTSTLSTCKTSGWLSKA